MTSRIHPLLARQLRRHGVDLAGPWAALLADVGASYEAADVDRELLERSLELTSRELAVSRGGLHRALSASSIATWAWSPVHDETAVEGYPSPFGRNGAVTGPAAMLLELVLDDDRPRLEHALEAALASQGEIQERFRLAGVSVERHLELHGRVDGDSNGQRLLGTLRDVTEEVVRARTRDRRLEAERRQDAALRGLTQALATRWNDVEACLDAALEHARDAIDVSRVTLWQRAESPARLVATRGRGEAAVEGLALPAARVETWLEALRTERVLTDDGATSAWSAEMRAAGVPLARAVLDAPVRVGGVVEAVVRLEREGPPFAEPERALARSLADVVALVLESAGRRDAEAALAAQHVYLRTVVDLAPVLVFARDRDGHFTMANAAVGALVGASPDEIVAGALAADVGTRLAPLSEGDARALEGETTRCTVEIVVGATRRTLELTKIPLVTDGIATAVLGVGVDVTERLLADAERRRLEESLRQSQKLESLGLLAGGVAHDFNNLLMPIISVAENAIEDLPADAPLQDDLRDVLAAAQRARDLTGQLLAFGRKQVLSLAVIDLDGQLERARRLLLRLVPENVAIEMELRSGAPVQVDATQLEQVMINLVANARDAMPTGGSIVISTRNFVADDGGERVEIVVSDSGAGIEPHHVERIFEPFYTTKRAGQGTGLGLATVYGIVRQHMGSIRVESEIGRGTRFVIELARAASTTGSARGLPRPTTAKSARILVVEDDDVVRKVVVRQLARRGGHEVVAAACAEDALVLVASSPAFDLLLTDVVLTGMSGPELVRTLAANGRSLPTIFMSGHAHGVLSPSGVLERGTRLLRKPFSTNDLLAAIEAVLGPGRGVTP